MEVEEAFKVGFLLMPPQNFLRKTWVKKYCALYNASHHGIQRVEVFDSEDSFLKQNPSKLIPLTDCIKVTAAPQKHQSNVFEVRLKSNSYQFSADNFQEMMDWLGALQSVAFGAQRPLSTVNPVMQIANEEKQEENMLYSSMDEPEIYTVKAETTDSALRNGLQGYYKLIITSVNFSIADEGPQGRLGKIILTWPYRHIRRYGCSKENFSFEAGRKCTSGEGLFTFTTNDGMQIFQSVESHMLALKASQGDVDIPNSPSHSEDKNSFFTSRDSLSAVKECNAMNSVSKAEVSVGTNSFQEHGYVIFPQNQISTKKSSRPLIKPPRKSKSNFTPLTQSNDTSFTEELRKRCLDNVKDVSGQPVSFSNDQNTSFSFQKQFYTETEESRTSSLSEGFKQLGCNANLSACEINSCSYDHLSSNTYAIPQVDSQYNNEHIYGKLMVSKQPTPIRPVFNKTYGSLQSKTMCLVENDTSPLYVNVESSNKIFPANQAKSDEREPVHFLKNDTEYAQVYKKNNSTMGN